MDIPSEIRKYLGGADSAVVAYSGGFDSTLLMKLVSDAIPGRCTGVMVDSPLLSERQRVAATDIAERLGISIAVKRIGWEDMPGVESNDRMRCYHCKRSIFRQVREFADSKGADVCMHGENADDLGEDRPGRRAAAEFGIRSPFSELGITRDMIVRRVDELNIPHIVKDTCMATRIPTGTPLTDELLSMVEWSEEAVREIAGVRQVRVRIRGDDAIIQTSPEEIPLLLRKERPLYEELKRKGLRPSIDAEGYRTH